MGLGPSPTFSAATIRASVRPGILRNRATFRAGGFVGRTLSVLIFGLFARGIGGSSGRRHEGVPRRPGVRPTFPESGLFGRLAVRPIGFFCPAGILRNRANFPAGWRPGESAVLGLFVRFGHERLFNCQRSVGQRLLRGFPFCPVWNLRNRAKCPEPDLLSKRQNSR